MSQFYLLIFLIAFLKSVVFSFFGLNFYDYGESLQNGIRILQGQLLYRDIWAFLPPADNYFPALILKIFGESILAVRIVESFLFATFILVVALLLKNILNKFLIILLTVVITFADLNSYLLFYNLFFFLALLLTFFYIKTGIWYWLYIGGLSLGLGALFRHDAFLTTTSAIVLTLIIIKINTKKPLRNLALQIIFLSAGFLIIIVPIILWLIYQGVLGEFLYLSFIKAPQISKILSSGFNLGEIWKAPLTLASLYQTFTLISYLFYLTFIFLSTYYLFKNRKLILKKVQLLLLFLLGIFQVPYSLSVIDMGHLIKAGVPVIVVAFALIQNLIHQKRLSLKMIYISSILFFLIANIYISIWWIKYNDTKLNFKQGTVFVNSAHFNGSTHPTASSLQKGLAFVEKYAKDDEYIFAAPYHALFYFLADKKVPGRFNNFAAGFVSEHEQDQVITAIENHQVNVVIYDPVNAPLGRFFKDYSPKIDQFITNNYEVVDKTDMGWLLMKKKDE